MGNGSAEERRESSAFEGDQPISRREFDARLASMQSRIDTWLGKFEERVEETFDKLERKLAKQEEARKPNLATIAMYLLPALVAAFQLVETRSEVRTHSTWIESHEAFSSSKSAALEQGIVDLRERARSLEQGMLEQETQNLWMSDIDNLESAYEEVLRNAHCAVCDREGKPSSAIVFPPRDYKPLQSIGRAHLPKGN